MINYNTRTKTYTTNGHKPDKNNVTVITKRPALQTEKQVQSFIGMISYLFKFFARLSEIVEPIRELINDKVLSTGAQNINVPLHR